LPEVLGQLVRLLRVTLPVEKAAVLLWDHPRDSSWVIDLAVPGMSNLKTPGPASPRSHLHRRAEDKGWPHWIHQNVAPDEFDMETFAGQQDCASTLHVRLRRGSREIGALFVGHHDAHAYGKEEAALLSQIAKAAAGPVDHAWRHELLNRRVDNLSVLIQIAQAASTADRPDVFPSLVAARIVEVLNVGVAVICISDKDAGRLRVLGSHVTQYGKDIPFSTALDQLTEPAQLLLPREGMGTGQPLVIVSSFPDLSPSDWDLLTAFGCETMAAFPLSVKDRAAGFILALDRRRRAFPPDDLELAQAIAAQMATLIERRQLLAETSYLQEFSERVIESVRDVIYAHDLEGNLTLVNRRAAELTGYGRDELLRMNIEQLVVPGDRNRILSVVRSPEARPSEPYSVTVRTKEGVEIPVQVNASLLYEGTQMVGAVGVLRDQREQIRWQEQRVRDERLRALGQMADSIAHDFNNMLAVIMGRVQLALREAGDDAELRTDLEAVLEAAQDGARTVRRMQNFTRKRTDRLLSPVHVNQVIREVVGIVQPELDRRARSALPIRLSLLLRKVPHVLIAESELRETLVHILKNAVEALPDGGTITVSTEREDSQVVIRVQDEGTGIAADVLLHVFEPFYTTKGPQRNGLGLSIAYGTITRYGGEIDIASEEGAGTTVTIRLSASTEKEITAKPTPPRPQSVLPRQLRILVVEDEAPVRNLVAKLLRSEGHEVIAKAEGSEALESFAKQSFDIVFTDLGMPGLSGWEVAAQVRARDASVPIVLVTGWGTKVEEEKLRESGVTHVITKPFRLEELHDCLSLVQIPRD
jgi:PAS domain S-box-containing protein